MPPSALAERAQKTALFCTPAPGARAAAVTASAIFAVRSRRPRPAKTEYRGSLIVINHRCAQRTANPHCTGGGIRSDGGSSARSGCAKQRSFLCPLSENRRPIPTEVPCGHFWRHLLVTKSGKNCSSQETPNRRCGMLPDIHSGCFRRFHTPILLKLTIVKDSLFDCGRRAAARSRSMRRAASFRHRRSKHSPPAVGRQTIIQLHIPDGLQSALASESSRISSSGWRADCKNSFVS